MLCPNMDRWIDRKFTVAIAISNNIACMKSNRERINSTMQTKFRNSSNAYWSENREWNRINELRKLDENIKTNSP